MPFRPSQRPRDLERAARVLGARLGADEAAAGSAPVGAGDLPAPDGLEELESLVADGGWVPGPPAAGGGGADGGEAASRATRSTSGSVPVVEAAVRRLTARATEDEVSRLDADLRRARRPGLLTVPDELRSGRRAVSSAALVSLLALVVAVGCAFVLRVLWAERSSTLPEVAPGPSRSVQVVGGTGAAAATVPRSGAASTAPGAVTAGPAAPTASTEIVVHVVGQVLRPGLVRLRAGARVADAIKQAGGARAGADLGALNLARPVTDGEQIRVPRPGEAATTAGPGPGGGGPSPGAAGGGAGTSSGTPVGLNTADAAALDSLPGVGPVLAQRIIDWRSQHGRFTSVDELGEVSGIGDKLLERLRPLVTL
ncbi:MAG: helix-hairpin-helix domain-containing protein [Terrabacter sp.]